jgi:hypothetical protein
MKFLGGYITYKGKGVPSLIKNKMELGLENINKCLVRDERKVRIYKEYFLPANRFILSIHDLTKTDLGELDAIANRYLKSWLGMPQGGFFLPVHSRLGMDVKSVSHLYKESQSLDIVRALIQGDHTVQTTVQAKVQHEQKWTRKSAISVRAAEIVGTILSSMEPAIGNIAVVKPHLVTQPQDPQPPQSPLPAPPGDLTFHYTRTKLWNQAHNHRTLSPFQHRLILSQKWLPSGEKLGEFFRRKRMRHGLLAYSSILCRKASHGSPTCGTFLVVSWNLVWIA